MKKKHDENEHLLEQTQHTYDFYSSVISNNDCTGLAPTGFHDHDQVEGYKELYNINPAQTEERSGAEARRTKK